MVLVCLTGSWFFPFVLSVLEIHTSRVTIVCLSIIQFCYYVVLSSFCSKKRNVSIILENSEKGSFTWRFANDQKWINLGKWQN